MHRLVGEEAETAPAMPRDHCTSQRHVPGRRPKHHDRGSAGDDREMHRQPEEPARYRVEDVGRQMRAHLSRVALHRITFIAASGGFHGPPRDWLRCSRLRLRNLRYRSTRVNMPKSPRRRRRLTAAARRAQLIEIGRTVFAERGYAATSVEEIAARAKVSKPIVYEHFRGKDGLYAVVLHP